jgi:hypothetical protein
MQISGYQGRMQKPRLTAGLLLFVNEISLLDGSNR